MTMWIGTKLIVILVDRTSKKYFYTPIEAREPFWVDSLFTMNR